ncbi:hypothetical protein [Capnocytophaga gingivalis]|jgi:hypothetical protein|uniref:CHAT domain-containing protein n=1 Tax=Capnocytophaga gingivalis TaxID=1017 RepID=A0ABU5Z7J2_9FLAO|nr:hypothetical protein [Capnocytophaga gingivalis]MEB3074920.1 hypothetical protein [Capnocytophaga gingivalis]
MINKILIVHALDESTKFLSVFKEAFEEHYFAITSNKQEEIDKVHSKIKTLNEDDIFIFLGHGASYGLFAPSSTDIRIFDKKSANEMFENKNIVLLSCKSSDFIKELSTYKHIIGFADIPSSMKEIIAERDTFGTQRNIDEEDIKRYNQCYTNSIIKALKLLFHEKITFSQLAKYIEFFLNKEIILILEDKGKENRKDLAELLFEFRNEMVFKDK